MGSVIDWISRNWPILTMFGIVVTTVAFFVLLVTRPPPMPPYP